MNIENDFILIKNVMQGGRPDKNVRDYNKGTPYRDFQSQSKNTLYL
jgi:hypothetical protein